MTSIKRIVAGWHLKWRRQKYQSFPISLPRDLYDTKNILVCLPPGQRELTMIKPFLPDLSRVFSKSEIYLMASPGSTVYDIFPRKGYRIMTPSSKHVSWSGMATRKYVELLRKNDYKVILDLNLRANYFVQSILLAFPRAIKIGRGNILGSPYYNLEIKTRFIRDEKNIYRSIIETIDNLKKTSQTKTNTPAS